MEVVCNQVVVLELGEELAAETFTIFWLGNAKKKTALSVRHPLFFM